MAIFKPPRVDPYDVYRERGAKNVKSRFLPNDYYYIDFTPFWWRQAMDNWVNYSDLTMADALYSWAVQSSPFLRSQIDKRLNPIMKRQFVFTYEDGQVDEDFTALVESYNWFRELRREYLLAKFYGIRVVGIDLPSDAVYDYPLRNIDYVNQAIREETYNITQVAYVRDYENLFYIQPETDQDFQCGLLEPITRAMIGYMDAYNHWAITSKSYSYPKMTVVYDMADATLEQKAEQIAANIDDPTSSILLPGKLNLQDQSLASSIEVRPLQTQMYPNAHEVFRQLIDSWKQEVMELITGGTLIGATEKNTNSEQLARIHVRLYKDLQEEDALGYLRWIGRAETRQKMATLMGDRRFLTRKLVEVPDKSLDIYDAERLGNIMGKVGVKPSDSFWEKCGLEASDIDHTVRNNNWSKARLADNKLSAQIKEIMAKIKNMATGGNSTNTDSEDTESQD